MLIFLRVLKKVNQNFLRVAGWGVVAGMAVISLVIPYEVIGRYLLGSAPYWSGELTVFSLVWVSMLGAAVGLPRGYQIGMTFFIDRLPDGIGRLVRILGHLVTLLILSVLIVYGAEQTIFNQKQTSPAMQLSMAIPYLAIPVGAMLMWLVTLEQALGVLTGGGDEMQRSGE
ncbi:MAG: TRAP transporter small permease [Peptococcaceae bacterium]|nr:TRAP transporter small permease [Peptococcaceae bacterium]